MKLSISLPACDVQLPLPASVYLSEFKSTGFSNAEHGLRHPVAIYDVSLRALVGAFNDAMDAELEYRAAEKDGESEREYAAKLEKTIDHLLDAATEHFDDAKSIVRVMFDAEGKKVWEKALRDLDALVKAARDFPARQANAIKHKQSRIRLVRVDSPSGVVVGYFVDGVDAKGSAGPSPYVHRGNTAFSLGRVFRTLACGTYFLSRSLLTVLSGKQPSPKTLAATGLGALAPVFDRLLSMDRCLFWDEPNSCPAITRRGSAIVLASSMPYQWTVPPEGARINVVIHQDGVTKEYRVPYLGDYTNPMVNMPGRKMNRAP